MFLDAEFFKKYNATIKIFVKWMAHLNKPPLAFELISIVAVASVHSITIDFKIFVLVYCKLF